MPRRPHLFAAGWLLSQLGQRQRSTQTAASAVGRTRSRVRARVGYEVLAQKPGQLPQRGRVVVEAVTGHLPHLTLRIGRIPDAKAPLVMERFEVVYAQSLVPHRN